MAELWSAYVWPVVWIGLLIVLIVVPLLLMPPSVGLIFIAPRLQGQWPAIAGAVLLGTLLTLLLSAALLQWLLKRAERKQRAPAP